MPGQDTFKIQTIRSADDGAFTAINIGPREQNKRLVSGYAFLVLAVLGLGAMIAFGAGRWWRLFLFPLYWISALGYFQARAKTCVMNAARGTCNLDFGEERIEDKNLVRILRSQANKVHLRSLGAAAILTAISLILP